MLKGQVSIGKVAARCPAQTEPLVARLRLSRLIESADLAPPGLPPQAILLVRRVVAPQRLSLAAWRAGLAWEASAREAVAALYRRAVRPTRGQPVSGAEAVIFEDMGELLAWLGVEAQARVIEQRWYWSAVLRGRAVSSPDILAQAWIEEPRFVPAAVAYLAEWRRVTPVLRLFSPAQVSAILSALAVEHDLPQPLREKTSIAPTRVVTQSVAESPEPEVVTFRASMLTAKTVVEAKITIPSNAPSEAHDATSPAPPAIDRAAAPASPSPQWARWLPPTESEWKQLPPPTQRLLGLAITLFRAPAQARSERFAAEMATWSRQAVRRVVASPVDATHSQAPSSRRTSLRHAQSPDAAITARQMPAQSGNESSPLQPCPPAKKTDALKPLTPLRLSVLSKQANAPSEQAIEPASPWPHVEPDQFVAEASRGVADAVEEMAVESSPFWSGMECCETEIGGVLYLLNLFRQTELPECFDEDFQLSGHVSGWGLAELLGRTLLLSLNETYCADPLWALLARLDGREPGERPATLFQCGDTYHMPTQWLARFVPPTDPWQIVEVPNRLALRHASGDFIIADRPLNGTTRGELAEEEARRYRALGIEARVQTDVHQSATPAWPAITDLFDLPLRRWMQWAFPFLRYLLVWALGSKPATDEEIARELLLRRGRVYCTATHVDLVMSLNEISLPARRAGLDTNPGWVRDLMRVVSFHFE